MISLSATVWSVLIYPLAFLFVLGIVVFVHEYGHFIVARLCGVGVEIFSIGFGKELVGWNDRHGTRWKLSAVPLGGFVKFKGDMNAASVPDTAALAAMSEADRRDSFQAATLPRRAAIVAAGPIFNFILSILVWGTISFALGTPTSAPRVGGVQAGSAAAAAGFAAGDIVRSIDGTPIETFADMQRVVSVRAGQRLAIVVERAGLPVDLQAVPGEREMDTETGRKRIGVLGLTAAYDAINPIQALTGGLRNTWTIIERTLAFVGRMFGGYESPRQLSGPIGILMMSGEVASTGGFLDLMNFMAFMSVSIGLLNLFPVPLLDGGHLLFYACEAVRGRPLSVRTQEIGFRIGLALVLMLMLFATWNDLVNRVWSLAAGRT